MSKACNCQRCTTVKGVQLSKVCNCQRRATVKGHSTGKQIRAEQEERKKITEPTQMQVSILEDSEAPRWTEYLRGPLTMVTKPALEDA
jgi:hypothetical protein